MKVLVADASPDDRGRVSEALRELPTFVVHGSVANLDGALRNLDDGAPDLVVTEVSFPDGDGLGLIGAASRHHAAPSVVVYTSVDSPEQRLRCLEAGADLYLIKGRGVRELQSGVRELARSRRMARRSTGSLADDRFAILGRMTGGVVHDLNNYFSVVGHALAVMQRRFPDREEPPQLVRAREALESATRLTATLLGYARGGAPRPVPLDLGALVQRTLDLMGQMIPNEIKVRLAVEPGLPLVEGVAPELEQLVLNLLFNACDAMPGGGELVVSLRGKDTPAITLEVSDSGRGVAAVAVAATGPTSPSSKDGRVGDGLGLGIVRAVAERHGAALRIRPRTGGGTRVLVVFAAG